VIPALGSLADAVAVVPEEWGAVCRVSWFAHTPFLLLTATIFLALYLGSWSP
jgi:hypothetical protein